jgi:hypothetical protein
VNELDDSTKVAVRSTTKRELDDIINSLLHRRHHLIECLLRDRIPMLGGIDDEGEFGVVRSAKRELATLVPVRESNGSQYTEAKSSEC